MKEDANTARLIIGENDEYIARLEGELSETIEGFGRDLATAIRLIGGMAECMVDGSDPSAVLTEVAEWLQSMTNISGQEEE